MSFRWLEDSGWSYLKATGADRVDFFHRLTTNRMPKAGEPLAHSFFLSVNAKVLAELWIGAESESLSLLVPAGQVAAAKENIDRYHFGEKLELHEPAGALFVVVGASPDEVKEIAPLTAYAAQPDPRYGPQAVWFFVEEVGLADFRAKVESLGQPWTPEEAELARMETGRPRWGRDYNEETLFLEMAQQGDFSETKGCYPGQEIVARVLHRGRLNRHLRGFESASRIPESWTYAVDGKEMARVTSSVPTPEGGSRGLLYVRREVGEDGAELKGTDNYVLTVRPRAMELLTGEPE